jgi:hypothetical protein
MALIDIDEFKDTMGIGNIYADPIVQDVLDAAENIITGLLTYKRATLTGAKYVDATNTATYYVLGSQPFQVGESVTISTYVGAPFEGSQTVLAVGSDWFTADKNHSGDHALVSFKPFGSGTLAAQAAYYDTVPEIRQAALAVAIDIWQTRMGQSGQQGVDFTPAPYKLGRSLFGRVMGLMGAHMAVEGMVG